MNRLPMIDQIRGFGFVLMFIFHFCFDLVFLLRIPIPMFSHPLWILFRMVIVACFLSMVGVCLLLNWQKGSDRGGFDIKRYGKRLLKLFLTASVITIATAIIMPDLVIFFGIIHLILASSLLAIPFVMLDRKYRFHLIVAGIALLVIGHYITLFESTSFWSFLWLTNPIPRTADYAPIVPWFGFVLIGIGVGHDAKKWAKHQYLPRPIDEGLRWCGRHALLLYLTHQPFLWAGFFAYIYLFLR
ncbi:MAG: DUF1624 domain-containing protein [Alphaproteobacteria bacterium]|nr:DUF1624 domain-containing protein [Alphaproteobacteria bacterium]